AQNKRVKGFSAEALARLEAYSFPGNVRELQNVVERAVAFARGAQVEADDLPARLLASDGKAMPPASGAPREDGSLLEGAVLPTLDELQRRYVRRVLDEVGGNRRRAAALLGIERRTLYRWLERWEEGETLN
ncbi:MAG TPA: helix-turn-helix domain-containing protein, partial [Azoarcus sp.]|nr:helix-turn-helix domain-containing protein [Azoarcus sp.]